MDENTPRDYEDISQHSLTGETISKWADRSSIMIVYKNGKFALIGEVRKESLSQKFLSLKSYTFLACRHRISVHSLPKMYIYVFYMFLA